MSEQNQGSGAAGLALLALKRKYLQIINPGKFLTNDVGRDGDLAQVRDAVTVGDFIQFKIAGVWRPVSHVVGAYPSMLWVANSSNPAQQYAVSGIHYIPVDKLDYIEYQLLAPIAGEYVFLTQFAMSLSNAGVVNYTKTHLAAGVGDDPDAALADAVVWNVIPGLGTNIYTATTTIAGVVGGDNLIVRLTRNDAPADTHPGVMHIIDTTYTVR